MKNFLRKTLQLIYLSFRKVHFKNSKSLLLISHFVSASVVAKFCISFLEVNVLLPPYMSFFCYHVFRNFPKFLNIKPCNPANYNPLKAGLLIASGKSVIFQEVVISFEIFRET